MKNTLNSIAVLLFSALIAPSAQALGPLDGEVGVAYWSNHFDADLANGELDIGTRFAYGEAWLFNNWGLKGAYYDSDLEESGFSNHSRTQIEVRKRLLSFGDTNFIAVGAGLESIALINGENSDGVRLSAEARIGLPSTVFLYGKAGWTPSLNSAGSFEDISSTEIEVGAHFTPAPFVSLRLGYIEHQLNYMDMSSGTDGSTSSGFFIGAGFHW